MIEFTFKNLQDRALQRKPGYVEAVLAVAKESNGILSLTQTDFERIRRDFSPSRTIPSIPRFGPGTELHKLLSKFGFRPRAGCKCHSHINQMNLRGTDWCHDNIDMIVGWLREEANRLNMPFVETAARLLIKRAIRNASRDERLR